MPNKWFKQRQNQPAPVESELPTPVLPEPTAPTQWKKKRWQPQPAATPVPNPAKAPPSPVNPRPGATGVLGDPFPERATEEFVPYTGLQQTELAANPVPYARAVPRYYTGPAGD